MHTGKAGSNYMGPHGRSSLVLRKERKCFIRDNGDCQQRIKQARVSW